MRVERSADVQPPKAIVNSAQLEKELCRMFANAVMFNPDPQRGFAAGFRFSGSGRKRKRRRLGDGNYDGEDEDEGEEESGEEDEGEDVDMLDDGEGDAGEGEDGGGSFVRDAREMFEDVERAVAAWRAVGEGE